MNHRAVRACAATLFLLACCWAAWSAVRAGASRLLAESAPRLLFTEHEAEAAQLASEAVRLCSSDPEAHRARAVVSEQGGRVLEAVEAAERAAVLRPRHYETWLRLGRARERAGDGEGAAAAFGEAVRLAPLYAEPRWQLGNTLLRMGRREEAFGEMRRAASSRPSILPYMVETAWVAYDGDARAVEQAIAPQTVAARMTLARFFAKRGKTAEAVAQYRATGGAATGEERRALLAELLAAGRFKEAREVWANAGDGGVDASGAGGNDVGASGADEGGVDGNDAGGGGAGGALMNGSFETRIRLDAAGFGWQFAGGGDAARVSLDAGTARGGARSLRIDFDGETDANARVVSQLVPVDAGGRYRLDFAGRGEKVVSGGLPLVAVAEAGGEGRELAQSKTFASGASDWQDYAVEFTVPEALEAVVVFVRREPCSTAPCPIFGSIWLDDFALKKLIR